VSRSGEEPLEYLAFQASWLRGRGITGRAPGLRRAAIRGRDIRDGDVSSSDNDSIAAF